MIRMNSPRDRFLKLRLSFLIAGLLLPAAGAARAEFHVWTLNHTEHVLRSAPPGSDGNVKLGAARNEWVSFQILVRSDKPVNGVNLQAGELDGPAGAVLRSDTAWLYRQHQLRLEMGTYRNDRFKPDWYPDPSSHSAIP